MNYERVSNVLKNVEKTTVLVKAPRAHIAYRESNKNIRFYMNFQFFFFLIKLNLEQF